MFALKLLILLAAIQSGLCQPIATTNVAETTTLVEDYPTVAPAQTEKKLYGSDLDARQKKDFNGERLARHIVGGGGVGLIGGGAYAAPIYAAPAPVISTVPVITSVPIATYYPSYPSYVGYPAYGANYGGYGGSYGGAYGGYGGGFGGGFGVAKIKVRGFGIGGGFLG